jgi:hypothetical protein
LASGKKIRQSETAKIDISGARVVGRKFGSFDPLFVSDSEFSSCMNTIDEFVKKDEEMFEP